MVPRGALLHPWPPNHRHRSRLRPHHLGIGAAMIGWYGTAMLCYVTPKEHLGPAQPRRREGPASSPTRSPPTPPTWPRATRPPGCATMPCPGRASSSAGKTSSKMFQEAGLPARSTSNPPNPMSIFPLTSRRIPLRWSGGAEVQLTSRVASAAKCRKNLSIGECLLLQFPG